MVSYFIYLNGENEYTAVSYRPHPLYCGVYLAQTYPELTGKNDEYELAYKVLERLDRNVVMVRVWVRTLFFTRHYVSYMLCNVLS